jgi:diguanylate cyclase
MDITSFQLPLPVALALVALLGYLFGRGSRSKPNDGQLVARREIKRANQIIKQLESISSLIRRDLANHHASVLRFKDRLSEIRNQEDIEAWRTLCKEADAMLSPTMQLATQMAHAYDEIRKQTNSLMSFSEVRTDPLTGLSNRRALDEALKTQFSMMARYEKRFSILIIDIDHFKQINDRQGHLYGDQVLRQLAQILDESLRETDIATRFGGEEFVIIMPETDLVGGCILGERLCRKIEKELTITISGGVAEANEGDSAQSLLARADTALYSAKSGGRNCVFCNTGAETERVSSNVIEGQTAK